MFDLHLRLEDEARFADYLARRCRERKEKRVRATGTPRRTTGTTTKPRRRAGATEPMAWLRSLTSSLVYGEKTPEGVRPSNTINQFRSRWNLGHRLARLANYQFADHFAGAATYYFFGSGDPKTTHTLVMIDIDVQKAHGLGNPAGAEAFARHLKARWPDLYFERSTGGKGVHAYLVIDKSGKDAAQVNAALKRLQDWLRAEADRVSADIELVEVKGTCPVIEFEAGGITSVRYGTFAKLPRDASRFGEWQGTTALSVDQLGRSAFDVPPPSQGRPARTPPLARRKALKTAGSVSGRLISEDEVGALPRLESFARSLLAGKRLLVGKWDVTDHDVAVALLLLRFFHQNPNPDGTLPTERVKGMWTGLFDAGDVQRAWNHRRWKAIRDFLSACGHIDWTDHRYYYGYMAGDKFVKGRACKFTITGEFADALDRVVDLPSAASPSPGGASFVETRIARLVPKTGTGYYRMPVKSPMKAEAERIVWIRAFEACEHLCAA